MTALRRNMSRRGVVRGAGREDTWEYPEAALREVIVNALVHRDLSPASRGTQTQVEMYPDRLVVRNPGGLFGPVKIDQLGAEGISSARNGSMMQVLEDVPIPGGTRTVCENRGSGIRTMISALRRARMSPPAFQDRIASFTVTFPNHTLLGEDAISWINSLGEDGLNDNQCFALAMLREGETMDNQTYRQVAGVDSQVARSELRDLVSRGLVTQVGSHRWTRYQLASTPVRRSGTTTSQRGDRRQQLLGELAEGPLSRAELELRTGLGTAAVRRWLGIMRDEGLIESTKQAVRSPNVLYRRATRIGDG